MCKLDAEKMGEGISKRIKKKNLRVKGVRWRFVVAYVDDKRGKTSPSRVAYGVGSVGALQSGDRLAWGVLVELGLLVMVVVLMPLPGHRSWRAARPSRGVQQ